MGFEQTRFTQDYQTIALLLSKAFGGNKGEAKPPDSIEEAEAQLRNVLNG